MELVMDYINPILYILNKVGRPVNKYHILKILYFADRKALAEYHQFATLDWYERKKDGPVAHNAYEILLSQEQATILSAEVSKYIKYVPQKQHGKLKPYFQAIEPYDDEDFSYTQKLCLDWSINEHINMSYKQLREKSHDIAYERAKPNGKIDKFLMAEAQGATPDDLLYLKELHELENSVWS